MAFTIYPDTVSTPMHPQYIRNNRTSTADAENVICTLYANSAEVGTWRKSWSASAVGYDFDIDVRSFVGRSIAPYANVKTSFFGELTSKGVISNTDAFTPYYLTTELEVRNSSGFLETVSGSGETSSTLYAVNAVTPLSDYTLREYYQPSATAYFGFLSDAPTTQDIGTSEGYFLSYLQRGTDSANFVFYNASGTETRNVVVNTGNTTSQEGMRTLKVGTSQILGTGSWTIRSGTFPTSLTNVAYYTVSVGYWDGLSYVRESEIRTLNIVGSCDWSKRVYWFGKFGGAEQYTFKGKIQKKDKTSGQIGQFAPTWNIDYNPPINSYSRGVFKTDSTSQITYEITEPLTAENAEWLRYLRRSPEVYMLDENNNYIPVTVEPGESVVEVSRTGIQEVSFTFALGAENTSEL